MDYIGYTYKIHGLEPNEKRVSAASNESKCNPSIPGCLKMWHQINRSQAIGTGIFKEIPKEIKVSRIDSDLLLDDESISEEMLVADRSKTNFNPKICKSWAKIVYGDFGSAKWWIRQHIY